MIASIVLALNPPVGSCLHFSAERQVVVVPYQRALDVSEATLELWFKADESPRFFGYLLSRNYGDLGYGLALHGRPKVFSQAPNTPVRLGVWTHLAVAHSKTATKVYVNGQLVFAEERNGPLRPYQVPMYIGSSNFTGEPGGEWTGFAGSIDEVRIWAKARSQRQIRETMGRYVSSWDKNLVAYFPFDEGKGQIAHDWSGHLISGSLGNSYQVDEADPSWRPGMVLKGRRPGMRLRK